MSFGSETTETEGAGNALPATAGNLPETKVESTVCPTMGKPSISGVPLHNHNIL